MNLNIKESSRNKIFFILIIGVIAFSVYLIFFVNSNGYKCMNNPSGYFISNLEKSNNATLTCNCLMTRNINFIRFSLDTNGVNLKEVSDSNQGYQINLSLGNR